MDANVVLCVSTHLVLYKKITIHFIHMSIFRYVCVCLNVDASCLCATVCMSCFICVALLLLRCIGDSVHVCLSLCIFLVGTGVCICVCVCVCVCVCQSACLVLFVQPYLCMGPVQCRP